MYKTKTCANTSAVAIFQNKCYMILSNTLSTLKETTIFRITFQDPSTIYHDTTTTYYFIIIICFLLRKINNVRFVCDELVPKTFMILVE